MSVVWNPWHGCRKFSEGCLNCYVYRIDAMHDINAGDIRKNITTFNEPIKKKRNGEYKHPSGTFFYTCFSSDFFLEDADAWRKEAWQMIKARQDCHFLFITKRIHRFMSCIPEDWGDGYDHVSIAVTTENQKMADLRLPIYLHLPIKHKSIICEPLLERMDISPYLTPEIESVSVGGESGDDARLCDYTWVLDLQRQCMNANISFTYHQTGTKLLKDGRVFHIPREYQQKQAKKAGIDYIARR